MSAERKYAIKDIQKAMEYFDKKAIQVNVMLSFDHLGRLIVQGGGDTVTIYDAETAKFPELTKTDRL